MSDNKHQFEKSSSLSHCDYDESCNRMEIKFSSGNVYHYNDVPKTVYEGLKEAKSGGSFFHTNIRPKFKGVKKE